MLCMVCKNPESWAEYTVENTIHVCHNCKIRFQEEILLYCQLCDSMCFIPKTFKNIERLKFFVNASYTHFLQSEVIIPQNGCPNCISFKHNILGEPKEINSGVRKL